MSTQEAKSALRRAARARRRSAVRPPQDAETLRDQVCALPEVQQASRVAAYVSAPHEPPTTALLDRWRQEGRAVLLPVVLDDLDLDWALDDAAHRPGLLRTVPEPSSERLGVDAVRGADVVVVPALAVDRAGRRLGQGGGSYDRALARLAAHTLVVAVVHPEELVDGPLPTEAHDRRVDVVVTAREVVRVSPRG
ncbi:5-formyltetrahydrofolate cyclo-ligase [Angustibacter sp. Root456]|uniref:5-formyltetrahydrofolate cyclo-ligase n=1 Tax=Angustibacter sp. Root456 TaxID=1736539 RepID=UPI0009EC43B3|nr:5-formyltetrahydrofolate cyclo-ligase [Angustibacter sp. Root456]